MSHNLGATICYLLVLCVIAGRRSLDENKLPLKLTFFGSSRNLVPARHWCNLLLTGTVGAMQSAKTGKWLQR